MQNTEQLEEIYVNKIKNLVDISMHGLFDNIVYLYENKQEFDDKHEIDNLINFYSDFLKLTDEYTDEDLDNLMYKCTQVRKNYKTKALNGLYGSYNLDFQTDSIELLNKPNYIFDQSDIDNLDDEMVKDYLLSLVDESFKSNSDFDTFTASKLVAITALIDNDFYKNTIKESLTDIDDNLLETFLNNFKIKSNAILKEYKLKEFKNAPLTVFDLYSVLYSSQNQMIVFLTFFEEVKKAFDEDLLLKDNFFALKKVLLENDDVFLEKLVDRNYEKLDFSIEQNDSINQHIYELNKKDEAFKSNFLHKYVDFLEEILFDDLHYFMQSTEHSTMGINIKDEILTTLDNLTQPSMSKDDVFADFFKYLSKNTKTLTLEQKLTFYKAITSQIYTQLKFLNIEKDSINFDMLISSINQNLSKQTLEDTKIISAYILD